ncbi:aminopeptidase P family protein [Desulfovibrio sp. OttesenSCG-928-M14]|nr:aminopeptidase P family protein [Desulfovibrio sp. OttesenSCG-928-M14]
MNIAIFETRREKLRALIHKAGLEALVVTLDANRFYLSSFELHDPQINESAGCLIIGRHGRDWLCTDPRYQDAARRLWDEDRIFIYKGKAMVKINSLLKDHYSGPVGFEAANLSVEAFDQLREGVDLRRAGGMVEALRLVKDAGEIAAMERSCALNHSLMAWLPGVLAPGRSEAQIAWDIEQFFRNHGAEELAFPSIVAINGNAALPHAEPGEDRLDDNCALLVDVGCRLDRYCSDQTRSFWVGDKPDSLFSADLNHIQEAQRRAISLIRPGADCAAIYAAAKNYLDEQGVGDLFTHGLGHGVGLQTHEGPSLGRESPGVLQAGMVLTVEPGLYRPGRFGVRWEYMVLVTEDGHRVL